MRTRVLAPKGFAAPPRTTPFPTTHPQFIKTAADYAWFVGSSALLLALPIVVELQRETTVLVLQRQREAEMAQMQEQARMMNASTIENLRQTASMMMGGGPPPPPAPGQPGGAR